MSLTSIQDGLFNQPNIFNNFEVKKKSNFPFREKEPAPDRFPFPRMEKGKLELSFTLPHSEGKPIPLDDALVMANQIKADIQTKKAYFDQTISIPAARQYSVLTYEYDKTPADKEAYKIVKDYCHDLSSFHKFMLRSALFYDEPFANYIAEQRKKNDSPEARNRYVSMIDGVMINEQLKARARVAGREKIVSDKKEILDKAQFWDLATFYINWSLDAAKLDVLKKGWDYYDNVCIPVDEAAAEVAAIK